MANTRTESNGVYIRQRAIIRLDGLSKKSQ